MKRLWVVQVIGNALAFWALFTWLGLRDSKTSQLATTFVFGLVILIPWLWMQNGTMAYCADRSRGLWAAFQRSLSTLALFALVAILGVVLFWALGLLHGPMADAGQKTASWLTLHLRKPVKPQNWALIYTTALWAVRWILLPVVLLPLASGVARDGARGFRLSTGRVFWLEYLIALVVGLWLPGLLMHWIPEFTGTFAQIVSFVVRFGIAYLLMITAWVAVVFFSGRVATRVG